MTTSPPSRGVSVVIATRNRPELLAKAVSAALAQDYDGPIEVIAVFDQAEPVHELERNGEPPLRAGHRNTRTPGLPGARNTGMAAGAVPAGGVLRRRRLLAAGQARAPRSQRMRADRGAGLR